MVILQRITKDVGAVDFLGVLSVGVNGTVYFNPKKEHALYERTPFFCTKIMPWC